MSANADVEDKKEEVKEQTKQDNSDEGKQEKAANNLSPKLQQIIKEVESLTVMELASLVKALEEKFGVSAQAAVAVAAGPAVGSTAPAEEKTSFQVVLTSAGDKKIQVIKEIRTVTSLGLKEAKELVESAPKAIKDGATKEEADKIKATIEAAGGKVEIK
jgi:large subunit ribosomal protein L7/L12